MRDVSSQVTVAIRQGNHEDMDDTGVMTVWDGQSLPLDYRLGVGQDEWENGSILPILLHRATFSRYYTQEQVEAWAEPREAYGEANE